MPLAFLRPRLDAGYRLGFNKTFDSTELK